MKTGVLAASISFLNRNKTQKVKLEKNADYERIDITSCSLSYTIFSHELHVIFVVQVFLKSFLLRLMLRKFFFVFFLFFDLDECYNIHGY